MRYLIPGVFFKGAQHRYVVYCEIVKFSSQDRNERNYDPSNTPVHVDAWPFY